MEPAEFESYKAIALAKGFLVVAASPLTRSSYHAGEDFARLKAARLGASCQPGECVTYPSPGRLRGHPLPTRVRLRMRAR